MGHNKIINRFVNYTFTLFTFYPLVYLILFDFSQRDNSPPYLLWNWSTSIYALFLKQNLLHVFTVSSQLKMRNMSYMCNRIKHVAMLTGGIKKSPRHPALHKRHFKNWFRGFKIASLLFSYMNLSVNTKK